MKVVPSMFIVCIAVVVYVMSCKNDPGSDHKLSRKIRGLIYRNKEPSKETNMITFKLSI